MITTASQYRQALQEATQTTPSTLPPFSLPRGTTHAQEVPSWYALSRLWDSKAGFIGRDTAALVHKIL